MVCRAAREREGEGGGGEGGRVHRKQFHGERRLNNQARRRVGVSRGGEEGGCVGQLATAGHVAGMGRARHAGKEEDSNEGINDDDSQRQQPAPEVQHEGCDNPKNHQQRGGERQCGPPISRTPVSCRWMGEGMVALPDGGLAERHDVGRRTEDYHGEQELHRSKELAFFAGVS